MADCVSLLDEELSSFVFNYLTENSASQYGEEEVCSDRLDADFPDFDLSQLDASDFDSVNCLSELHWCNDHSDGSPASTRYSPADAELFETEEENAALLAALTDSLDGIVGDEAGGLSVFPSLGEDPEEEEEEEEEGLPLDSEAFAGSLSPEPEDPSLLKKLLLSPPNVPVAMDSHRDSGSLRRSLHLKPLRLLPKSGRPCQVERKPRAVRPAGRLCTELHRHLTTTTQQPDAEEEDDDDEEEEEEDSDSEEDEEEDEEEESSSSSEVESSACAEPAEPQFTSEKERHSVVELIRYMHTYCLPTRKQASWDRKEREATARRAKADNSAAPRGPPPSGPRLAPHSSAAALTKPRVPFARQRETRAHSLLKDLLEAVTAFDVSKPYRLHSPPYEADHASSAHRPKAEPKDSGSEGTQAATKRSKSPEPGGGSFSVRRSRRLASCPGQFGKKTRPCSSWLSSEEEGSVKHPPMDPPSDDSSLKANQQSPKSPELCCNSEKRACLCLPLTPKSTGDTQYGSRAFEQTLCVELCGTAGLTPPTTPPHKPVEEELFKPEGKAEPPGRGVCPGRAHVRKLPEQTELYAQLRRMGHTGEGQAKRAYGDHDYCLLNLGESRKRSATGPTSPTCHARETDEDTGERSRPIAKQEEAGSETGEREGLGANSPSALSLGDSEDPGQPSPACSPSPEADTQSPESFQPPSPCHQLTLSCESSEMCRQDKRRNRTKQGQEDDVDKCQVFYIHNLPSSVTQAMLCRRFQALGRPSDCQVLVKDEERCGVITLRQTSELSGRPRRDSAGQHTGNSTRRLGRKRYIDLDEAGPGPVKSKYDALDFDTLLKEAQRSLHR